MPTTEQGPRVAELEATFARYPDEPREVILKADLLSLGHWFSDAALAASRGCLVKSYRLFSYDLVPMEKMQRNESRRVPEFFTIFGGPYGLRPVIVQTTLNPSSPYLIDVVEQRLVLRCGDELLAELRYPKPPAYYQQRFPDGTWYHEIIAFGFFITAFRACQYWGPKEECRFCDINRNLRQMQRSRDFTLNAPVKPVDYVRSVADSVAAEQFAQVGAPPEISFLITGGTVVDKLHGKSEDDFYAEYVRAVRHGDTRRHVSLQTNAKPKATLEWFRDLGVSSHHANMEVWDPKLFAWLCPGKHRQVGRDEWVRRLIDSVDVFGPGEVKPLFVGGVEMARPHGFKTVDEAVESTAAGVDFLMSHGVVPRFNQWRREFGSPLVEGCEQPPIPLDYTIRLMRRRYESWKRYKLPLPNMGRLLTPTRHLGVGHGTYEDEILLLENTYPDNILEIVEQNSLQPEL